MPQPTNRSLNRRSADGAPSLSPTRLLPKLSFGMDPPLPSWPGARRDRVMGSPHSAEEGQRPWENSSQRPRLGSLQAFGQS
jgi:hypothetical protein